MPSPSQPLLWDQLSRVLARGLLLFGSVGELFLRFDGGFERCLVIAVIDVESVGLLPQDFC